MASYITRYYFDNVCENISTYNETQPVTANFDTLSGTNNVYGTIELSGPVIPLKLKWTTENFNSLYTPLYYLNSTLNQNWDRSQAKSFTTPIYIDILYHAKYTNPDSEDYVAGLCNFYNVSLDHIDIRREIFGNNIRPGDIVDFPSIDPDIAGDPYSSARMIDDMYSTTFNTRFYTTYFQTVISNFKKAMDRSRIEYDNNVGCDEILTDGPVPCWYGYIKGLGYRRYDIPESIELFGGSVNGPESYITRIYGIYDQVYKDYTENYVLGNGSILSLNVPGTPVLFFANGKYLKEVRIKWVDPAADGLTSCILPLGYIPESGQVTSSSQMMRYWFAQHVCPGLGNDYAVLNWNTFPVNTDKQYDDGNF